MGYDICLKCLKYTVFSLNFLFWLLGLGVLGASIWLRFSPHTTLVVGAGENLEKYYTGVYILIGAGALMTLIGFVGCCGAYHESQCLLAVYFMFLLIIFGAEIGGATWAYTHKLQLKKFVDQSLRDTVQHDYGRNKAKTIAYDFIQSKFRCCGGESPFDWNFSYFATGKDNAEVGIGDKANKVPVSCCTVAGLKRFGDKCGESQLLKPAPTTGPVDDEELGRLTTTTIMDQNGLPAKLIDDPVIFQTGCSTALEHYLGSNLDIIIGIAIAIIILQLLGLLLSILLCCYIRRSEIDLDDYK